MCVCEQLYQVQNGLEDGLQQWKAYTAALTKVNQSLMDTEFTLAKYSVASGDIQLFKTRIGELQVSDMINNLNFVHK